MDTKYKSHSFVKLWIATTIFILCCFTTDMSAQNAAAADTVAAVTETIYRSRCSSCRRSISSSRYGWWISSWIEYCMDVACSNARILHAAGIALVEAGLPEWKYCQHSDEELCRFHVRLFTILVYRFRIDVRRRRIHRNASLLRPFFH